MSVRLDKLMSNLGYGSRKEVVGWVKSGRLRDRSGARLSKASIKVEADSLLFDGEPLDPTELLLVLHKPAGYTCSHRDRPPLIFELLPQRFSHRKPALSCVGRLDKDTTGIMLLTDQGQLLHRLTSPTWKQPKVYQITSSLPVEAWQVEKLSQGGWCLPDDDKPLEPAHCRQLDERELELTLTEGRYHQVKRMMEAVGNPLTRLHRSQFAGLTPEGLEPGQWRHLNEPEQQSLLKALGLLTSR